AVELETIYQKFQSDKPNLIAICGYCMEAFQTDNFVVNTAIVEKLREVYRCNEHVGTEGNPVWDVQFKTEDVSRKAEQQLLETYIMEGAQKKADEAKQVDKSNCDLFLKHLQNISQASTTPCANVVKRTAFDVNGPHSVAHIQKFNMPPADPTQLIEMLEQRAEALQAELAAFKFKESSFSDAMSILARSATESLKRERDVHNQILSVLPVGVLCAESWREQQMYVNKTFCEMVKCAEADVMSGDWLKVVHAEDREKVQNLLMNMGELCDQEPVKLEYRITSSTSTDSSGNSNSTASSDNIHHSEAEQTHQYKHEEEDLVWVASETIKCNIKGRWVFVHAIVDTTEVKRVNAERTLLSAREAYQMQKAADADKRRLLLDEFID
ncbi:hypothetical protein HDV05_002730, partial [Chytridiales sp. JEL 0842]